MKRIQLCLLLLGISIGLFAQPFDYSKRTPVDTSITIGKLPNGLTYYIKKNSKPENRMELRLAVNVGSILEDEDQLGLAHFTEHMAFNGTQNFAKNDLVSYLQTMGIRFGADLNAYTSFDETVYMLFLPTDTAELLEKGFLVLQDWAGGITFDSSEIEKERGVVIEEWRLGRGADQRMMDKYIPVIFHESQYAKRLPIGDIEVIKKFDKATITRFYKDWYRPDLMAIVAVGDFDKAQIEKEIIAHFSNLKPVAKPRARKSFPVPNHLETLYCITSDKEANMTTVGIYHKSDPKTEITQGDYRESIKRLLYFKMLNQRVDELTRSAQPPFINAYAYYGNIAARTKYAYAFQALVSDTGISTGLKSLLIENERIKKYGFTPGEVTRAKKEVLSMFEQYYNERDKSESEQYAAEFIRNFLTNEPIPGINFEYNFVKYCLPDISIDEINLLAHKWIADSNRVIIVTAPEKEGLVLPDESELKKIVDETSKIMVLPYTESESRTELIQEMPMPGTIVSAKEIKEIVATELVLSNGVKVILKPTDYKNDEILVSAVSPGGQSLYEDKDHYSAFFAASIIRESGVSDFSVMDLQKVTAGKAVSVSPYISSSTEGIKASCVPKDIQTMFELIYLYIAQPRIDTMAFESWKSRTKSYLVNISSDPQVYYSDQFARILSQNHPRGGGIPQPGDLDKIDLNRIFQIYKDRFSNVSDFTFTIVGNFNTDSIRPYIEKYVASLPATNRVESWKDLGIRPPQGEFYKNIYKGEDQKSMVSIIFTDSLTFDKHQEYYLSSFAELLDIRLIEVLREEKGGVYGVGASATMNRIPYNNYSLSIRFPCSPDNVDSLVNQAIGITKEICTNGVSDVNLQKIKETQLRELEVSLKTNNFWLTNIENTAFYNEQDYDMGKLKTSIEKLTKEDIQKAACRYSKDKFIKVVLMPEKKK